MNNIFVFTAGNADARSHLDASIRNSINKELVLGSFDTSEHEALLKYYGEAEGFYAWGAVPGPQNESRWKAMTAGDVVFCVYESTYHYVAKLLGKYENEKLARAIWGEDENHQTWQYLYFLTKPAELNIPIKNVANYLNEAYWGFTRIGDDKIKNITLEHGNIENFVERVFFDRHDDNAQEEFINIVKRYQEEGTVFRSATQGTRYFIQAADSSGCVVRRVDAEESERCTASLYLEKRKIIRERGGSLRFNDLELIRK